MRLFTVLMFITITYKPYLHKKYHFLKSLVYKYTYTADLLNQYMLRWENMALLHKNLTQNKLCKILVYETSKTIFI